MSVLGQGLDELVRHHPSLKELVMKAFIAAMELGLTVKPEIPQEQLSLYSFDLQRAAPGELESDVKMVQADVKAEEAKDPVHVHCIEVIARVCCVCVLWKGRHKDSRHTIHHTSFSSLKAFSRMRSIAKSLSISAEWLFFCGSIAVASCHLTSPRRPPPTRCRTSSALSPTPAIPPPSSEQCLPSSPKAMRRRRRYSTLMSRRRFSPNLWT